MEAQYSLRNHGLICKTNPHLSAEFDIFKMREMLNVQGGEFVRNTFNWDKPVPTSFWYVIKDSYGGIDELSTKVRNQVRKSLRCYDVRLVSGETMFTDGFELFNNSRRRFGDKSLFVNREAWKKRCSDDGRDFWLVYDRETGIPHAFAINKTYEDYCSYETMGVNPDAPSSSYPIYGLIVMMNQFYLVNKKLQYVCDGARSVTEHSNIQPFLIEKFKFRKAYCDMKVYYKPLFGLAVKLLYPFRRVIHSTKITAILNQEAMARGQM